MAAEVKEEVEFEIAHVLFVDIVAYSRLSIGEQRAAISELTEVVRASKQFQGAEAADRLIKIPTGDGMALVFYTSPEAPAQCAIEINRMRKEQHPLLQLRMGVHSGPVSGVIDVNGHPNLAGAGLNLAQRMMVCGDAGHILVSKHAAQDLEGYERWQPLLHDLGECEVKHGVQVGVVNLYGDEVGNPQLPKKFQALKHRTRVRRAAMIAVLLVFAALFAGVVMFSRHRARSTPLAPEKSIAVLPFENLSRDPDNAYFAGGIQDEILTLLSKIADLKVISRASTQNYKSASGNLREIAEQLGVAYLLEGSVQKGGDAVRVNVQLIKAADDSHVWADTFDRKLTDIFGVESEIAKRIAESLQAKLSGREEQALAVKPTNNPEAYDAYLRGVAFEARSLPGFYSADLEGKATGFYERAVQLDPNFAVAWARLSRADAFIYFTRADATTGARGDAAKRALENAQKLEPNSPETLLALGYYQYWVLRDFGASKATFGRVSKLLPGSSEVPRALGLICRREGQWNESVTYFEQGLALDPRNVVLLMDAAATYVMLRQFPAALKLYDRALDITPNDPVLMVAKASIYQAQGNLQEAAKYLSETNAQTPAEDTFLAKITQLRLERNYGEAIRLLEARQAQFHFDSQYDKGVDQLTLALTQRLAGNPAGAKVAAEQARDTLEQLYRDQPDNYHLAAYLSQAYAAMGVKDLAIKSAERAIMLLPRAKDPMTGPGLEENLALIQTIFGDSRAISALAQLLQTPYESWVYPTVITSAPLLRLDPLWDPLRTDPAFQQLCEEKQQ